MPRPRIPRIDPEVVKALAAVGCARDEIATYVGCTLGHLERKYSDLIDTGKKLQRVSLRRKQMELAMQGDRTMLVWLGKIVLGQRETQRVEHEGVEGGVPIHHQSEVIQYQYRLPDNGRDRDSDPEPKQLPLKVIGPQAGPQEAFLSSPADIVIFGGGAGGGKTFGLLLEAIRHVDNKHFTAVIFRRTYPQIMNEGGLWDTSLEVYPPLKCQSFSGRAEHVFPTGASVRFAHLEHDKSALDWQGAQVPLIGFDELTHFSAFQFWYLLSRNRSTCGVKPYIRATTNPDCDSWVREFIDWWIDPDSGFPIPERAGLLRWFLRVNNELIWGNTRDEVIALTPQLSEDEKQPKSLTFIPSLLEDNPALVHADPSYMANLNALPLVEQERLRRGNWKIRASAGLVFPMTAWGDMVNHPPEPGQRVRYWDKAGTVAGCYTVGVLMRQMGTWQKPWWCVEDVKRGKWVTSDRDRIMTQTASQDGVEVEIVVEQEGGSGGKESAEASVRMLAGYRCRIDRTPISGKLERADPLSAQVQQGNVKLVRGAWNTAFIDELAGFPEAKYNDQVDAASGAFNWLTKRRRWTSDDFETIRR